MATVDSSCSLTVAVGASIWGVEGVLFLWGGRLRLVLPFIIIIIIIIIIIVIIIINIIIIIIIIIIVVDICVYVCVCFNNGTLNN